MVSILEQFGTKVRHYRLKKNISQEELAEKAELHRTYIGQIECGKRNVALRNVYKIAQALSVSIRDLF